jgi:hypothetical protein
VAEPVIVLTHAQTPKEILARKVLTGQQLRQAEEIGAALSEGLADGIF